MPHNRYFTKSQLKEGYIALVEDRELHHLTHVMRKQKSSQVELIDGKGSLALGTIEEIKKKEAQILVDSVASYEKNLPTIILIQSIIKPSLLDYVIEKGTEVGISSFALFSTKGAGKQHITENQKTRLEYLALSATKQCGRLFLPKITIYPDLSSCLSQDTLIFYGHLEEEKKTLFDYQTLIEETDTITLVIGPEKGFSIEEKKLLSKHAHPVLLHKNILRAETAGVVGSYLLSQLSMQTQS